MNEKNLPDDIASKSLNELTDLADEIIKNLENRNNLENTSEDYAKLLKINRIVCANVDGWVHWLYGGYSWSIFTWRISQW